MADEFFRIEWEGLDELKTYFKQMDNKFKRICMEELTDFGLKVEDAAKALAPLDTGDLEDSITASIAELKGTVFEVIIGTNLEYALRVHEQPESSGIRDKYERGVKYEGYYVDGKGENTRNKSNLGAFEPGPKYLQNAVTYNEENWNKMCERILKRMLEE